MFRIPILMILVTMGAQVYAKNLKYTKEEKAWLRSIELIITSDERKFFRKACTTHEARRAFIDLFWAKRDPDLSDDVNPFKQAYQARSDYIAAHFRELKNRAPRTDRGYVYMLLGPPTKIQYRTDERFVGLRYYNPFPEYPPELWIYENLPFDVRGNRILIQMVPKNRFGDYDALVNAHVDHLLRNLKYEFIVHPDLEVAPIQAEESEDLQVISKPAEKSQNVPVPIPSPSQEATDPLPDFVPTLGNDLGLTSQAVILAQATDSSTVLVRIGFPLASLISDNHEGDERNFSLQYALADDKGEVLREEIKQHALSLPDSASKSGDKIKFSQSFTALLNPGTYSLRLQFRDLDTNSASFLRREIEVPDISRDLPTLSPLFFLTPASEIESQHLKLAGQKLSPRLSNAFVSGEPIYLLFQMFHHPEPLKQDQIRLSVFDEDRQNIKSWSLFPEELGALVGQAQTCFPRLDTKSMEVGNYTLRCEVTLKNGNILIKERRFQIQ